MLTSTIHQSGANGITASAISMAPATTAGASTKKARSPNGGTQSSLVRSLMASATACSTPNQPTRFGPSRSCHQPSRRRSHQTRNSAATSVPIATGRMST